MDRQYRRALLAGVLGLGVWSGLVRADPPDVPGPMALGEAPAEVSPRRRPLRDWVANLGCWSHHNRFGCGSFRSEMTFIFGSCRAFFGDPCRKGPPPSPLPSGPGSDGCTCR